MGKYDHILPKYNVFFKFEVGEIRKIRLWHTVIFVKNNESAECTNNKHRKPTLHSLIAKHVLEMSIKLKFQCEHLKRSNVLLWWF